MTGLLPGDRIPDFSRPDASGKPRFFYDVHHGQPVVLFVCGRATDAATRADLAALARPDQLWGEVSRVALVQGTPAELLAFGKDLGGNVLLLADDGPLTQHLVGAPPTAVIALTLDDNLRIVERMGRSGDAGEFAHRVAHAYADRPVPVARTFQRQAPVLFIPRVFDAAFCDGLIAHFEETGGTPSGTAYMEGDKALWKPDPSVKMRRDVYLESGPWLERVRDALVRRVLPEIQRCFNFQVSQHEVFKLIRYDAGAGYFNAHRDNESRDTQHRRFAMTLNLNTGAYDGGELRFPEFGPDLYVPERGSAVIFSCSLLHEVTPVTRGSRYGLLGFFFSEKEQMLKTEYQAAGK
ncbi:MAG TPA: 2OG-Fe(II) oxygenase [Gammaproteobacteria bacterium]|jgi:predicted 2-oxoglutarate/Fe(II)-dependent dioxygenase YbiX